MPEIKSYADSYYSMTWLGPKGYPENANSGRCYLTGVLGMLRHWGETDLLFADGLSGDGFSFRWCPTWGAPAFNGGKGAFHEMWEYTPRMLGYRAHWEEDEEDGWDAAFAKLRDLVDRGIPVQVGVHYNPILPYGTATSPRLAHMAKFLGKTGYGHHVVVAGYDLDRGMVTIYEPNDIMPHARYECPIPVFRRAWEEASQRVEGRHYVEWADHKPWDGEWSLHDGYGPYLMVWIEPGKSPDWDIAATIRHSFLRNLKILRGEYPKPYTLFGSQWQIPHWETGAPGMAVCAEAIRNGRLKDTVAPGGTVLPLFVKGNIPNHGVLGRAGAAGYLRRVAAELARRNHLKPDAAAAAADLMQHSSDLFRTLCYEETLAVAGEVLSRIAETELKALEHMERAWEEVRGLAPGKGQWGRTAAE